MSERRARTLIAADRTMVRYRSRRPPGTGLRVRLRELANQRRRLGYRRLFILLRREGEPSGVNRIYRLYREEGSLVRLCAPRAGPPDVQLLPCTAGWLREHWAPTVSAGIIDPTKVMRTALHNAASLAGLLVTTEAMVAEHPKKESPTPMPGGGGGIASRPALGLDPRGP